jgi:AcrR family transcriptional regulator
VTSPRPDHRARKRAETHRRIYRAAMDLFREHGYDAVTVGQIVAASQVSVPTFYDHFPSKDHLIMALPERARIEALLARQSAGLTLGARMRELIHAFLASLESEELSDVLARWRIITATPGLRYRAAQFERTTAQMILEALGLTESDDETVAQVVVNAHLSAYTHILVRWAEVEGRTPLEEVAEEVLAALHEL